VPNKPIISIDVNDQQFKAFFELFQQFKGQMGELPEEWKQVGQSAQESHEAMAGAAGAIVDSMLQAKNHASDLAQHLKGAVEAQKQFRLVTSEGETGLKRMGKEAKELADTLFGIGKFLFKLGAIGVGLGAGALFGIDRLAESAVGNQRQARGLGLTTGQFRAFSTDVASRGYSDEATLAKISDAKNDYVGRAYLAQATGLTMNEIMGTDAGTLAVRLAMKEHALWNSTAPEQRPTLAQLPSFQYLGQGTEQFQRNGAASPAELQSALANYQRDSKNLNISNKDTDALYSFSRRLTLAGQDLETYFTSKLAQLGPKLGDFITNLENDAKILLDEVLTPDNLKKVGESLKDFAQYLGSDDFRKTLREVGEDIKTFGSDVMAVAKFIADLLPDKYKLPEEQIDPNSKIDPYSSAYMKSNPYNFSQDVHRGWFGDWKEPIYQGPYYNFLNPNNPDYGKYASTLKGLEGQYGLQSGLLNSVEFAESAGVQNSVSPKGAKGPFQFTDATAKDYGITDPYDFGQSSKGAAQYLSNLSRHYRGDIRKELAAYNWGPGNVDADIVAHRGDWEKYAPTETKAYIDRVLKLLAKNQAQGTKVTVINKPGTNVSVSTNAGSI